MNRHVHLAWALVIGFAVLLISLAAESAFAEEQTRLQMEEIIVTAEKREASVQDTAATLSAFDSTAIERENIDNLQDIQFSVPNMLVSGSALGGGTISLRGLGLTAVGLSADPATAVHVNGAYTQTPPILELELFDVERVEILRGPQGTLSDAIQPVAWSTLLRAAQTPKTAPAI